MTRGGPSEVIIDGQTLGEKSSDKPTSDKRTGPVSSDLPTVANYDEVTPVTDLMNEGELTREWSYCGKECFSRGGHYRLAFPKQATVDEKVLLIVAAMTLDTNFHDRSCCLPFFFF
mmetsp:Transcript_18684/g.28609  ORF Transcript_18684/g.28609 Transcript_18684/m.28609 type:complete len:116 (+) Transcript_18684:1850-2197(+)